MITKIEVCSRSQILAIKDIVLSNKSSAGFDNIFCISIYGSNACGGFKDSEAVFSIKEILSNSCDGNPTVTIWNSRIISLMFDDLSPDIIVRNSFFKDMKFMSEEQAEQIIIMLERWNTIYGNNLLIIHCAAGIMRSGAVGKFAAFMLDQLNCNNNLENKLMIWNPNILKNDWVLMKLYEVIKNN